MTLQIARLIGAAGSGKTTELLRIMEGALPALDDNPLRLGFASFTRAARAEAVGRAAAAWNVPPSMLEQDGWFRTIHSTAMKCLGVGRGQLISDAKKDIEWISNALGVRLSTTLDDEAGKTQYIGDPVVAASLNCWSLARTSLLPLEDVVRRMRIVDDSVPDFAAVVAAVEKYEMQKRVDDRLDFNDLLLRFGGVHASPRDGMSTTTPQGSLPEVDAWLFDEQQDASPLLDVVCKRLVSAPSVRWCYVVGDPFQCQPGGSMVLTDGGYKPIEDLDPDLDRVVAFDTKTHLCVSGRRFLKAFRDVDSVEILDIEFSDGTVCACTTNHKWFVPSMGGFVRASALNPSHAIPKCDCETVDVVRVSPREPGEPVRVYSLEVSPQHTYVTNNGIVTGNSIYGFAGSSAECFLGWPAAKERTMPKSYRCPAPILELGERCLRRMKSGYFDRKVAPADHEGRVIECGGLEEAIGAAKPDENWLFIARTNYQAKRVFAALQSNFKPCRWVKTQDGSTNRTEGLRALYALERDELVTGKQWQSAMQLLPVVNKAGEQMLTRGVKSNWGDAECDRWDRIFSADLPQVGAEPALIDAIKSGRWCGLVDRGSAWRQQAVLHGAELAADPKISVGTIHSVKGAEADNVVVLTTTAAKIEQGMENPNQADEEHRIAYVAVTRARRNLYIVNEGRSGRYVPRMEVL